jgi:hypothetical protein
MMFGPDSTYLLAINCRSSEFLFYENSLLKRKKMILINKGMRKK